MKERQILFNAQMVRAILAGWKTQTRRVAKPPKNGSVIGYGGPGIAMASLGVVDGCEQITTVLCPYGQPGDRLWVRETWQTDRSLDDSAPSQFTGWPVLYEADAAVLQHGALYGETNGKVRPSIHMPRWASRIILEITAVRVERLQDIGADDCVAEGCGAQKFWPESNTKALYLRLWESINGAGSWDANPWVWAIEFKRVEQ